MNERAACRVFFFGPVTRPGDPHRGGPNAANRRAIDGMRRAGFLVREFASPAFTRRNIFGFIAYVWRYCSLPIVAFGILLAHRRPRSVVYVSALYVHLVYLELALILVATLIGHRTVCELRAGSFPRCYEAGSFAYRAACRAMLRSAGLLISQDPGTIEFIQTLRYGPVEYVPNHVAEPHVLRSHRDDDTDSVLRLIYFGALIPEKGVGEVIHVCADLAASGALVRLVLVGDARQQYRRELEALTRARGIEDAVAIRAAMPPEDLLPLVSGSHFFVFPTRWDGEGHSNALTEAMARGVVPVCRDWGCNALVVGDAGRILDGTATPREYAQAIGAIWSGGDWPMLSGRCVERVRQHYTTERVLPRLIELLGRPDP